MRTAPLLVAAATYLAAAATGLAGWSVSATGDAAAAATSLPAGPTPSATVPALSLTVTVSWASAPLATGYVLTRFNALGVAEAPGGTCAGVVTATSCSEPVLAGTYRYAVSLRRNAWTGPAGSQSPAVTAPGL